MEYKGRYSIKNSKQPCLCCLQLYTNELTSGLFPSEREGLLDLRVTSVSSAKPALSPEPGRTYGVDRRGMFPNYATALMQQYIPSISLASSNCSSQTTLCHLSPHTDARSLLPGRPAQPTLWLPHPHCYSTLLLPEPSVSLAVLFHISVG